MLHNNISLYRKILGLTQEELGQKVGVSRQTINNLEKQKTVPSSSLLVDIAIALEVRTTDLLED